MQKNSYRRHCFNKTEPVKQEIEQPTPTLFSSTPSSVLLIPPSVATRLQISYQTTIRVLPPFFSFLLFSASMHTLKQSTNSLIKVSEMCALSLHLSILPSLLAKRMKTSLTSFYIYADVLLRSYINLNT